MKKGETPKLDSEWWKKNKPGTLNATGLGAALRTYEVHVDKFEWAEALEALEVVEDKVAEALKKCSKVLHGDVIECLKKYPAVLKAETARLEDRMEAELEKEDDQKAPKQTVGDPEVLWSKSLGAVFMETYGSKHPRLTSVTGGVMELKLNADLRRTLEKEGAEVIAMRMVDSCNKLFDRCLAEVHKRLKTVTATEDDELEKEVEDVFDDVIGKCGPIFKKIPDAEWNKFLAKKKQYKDYQVKVVYNAGLTTLKAAATAVSLGGAVVTGGATLAMSIVGAVYVCTEVAKQIREAAVEAEDVLHALVKDLGRMKDEFEDVKTKAGAKAKAVGSTIGNTILGYPAFPSIARCRQEIDLADDKTAGLSVKHVKLGREIGKALSKLEALDKVLYSSELSEKVKIQKKVAKLRAGLDDSLNATHAIGARVHDCEGMLKKLDRFMQKVEAGAPSWIDAFDRFFPLAYNLAVSTANAGCGVDSSKSLTETGSVLATLGAEVLSEIKKQVEM